MLKRFLIFFTLFLPAIAHAEPLQVEQAAPGVYVHHGVHQDITHKSEI